MTEDPIQEGEYTSPPAQREMTAIEKAIVEQADRLKMTDNERAAESVQQKLALMPAGARGELAVTPQDVSHYAGAGTIRLSTEQAQALTESFEPDQLDITPDGNVYVPQIHYRRRLTEVFGPGGWALVPVEDFKVIAPKPRDPNNPNAKEPPTTIVQRFVLKAWGCFISEAIGECNYYANNDAMTKASAVEGAKSSALMRCCKDLGMGSECWDKRFTDRFKAEHCRQEPGKGKYGWKRK